MRVPLVWAVLIAIPAGLTFLFDADTTTHLLFAVLIGGAVLIAVVVRGAPKAGPDASLGGLVLAVAITALVVGAEVGRWLLLIGAGTAVLGLVVLRGERR
jgi:hypothetical protein